MDEEDETEDDRMMIVKKCVALDSDDKDDEDDEDDLVFEQCAANI
jgi:hypothetical protein